MALRRRGPSRLSPESAQNPQWTAWRPDNASWASAGAARPSPSSERARRAQQEGRQSPATIRGAENAISTKSSRIMARSLRSRLRLRSLCRRSRQFGARPSLARAPRALRACALAGAPNAVGAAAADDDRDRRCRTRAALWPSDFFPSANLRERADGGRDEGRPTTVRNPASKRSSRPDVYVQPPARRTRARRSFGGIMAVAREGCPCPT